MAVMVAEAIRTRSLTCEGVSGVPAPSITAAPSRRPAWCRRSWRCAGELAQQGRAGAAQGRVGLGGGGIAAGIVGEIGVYLDDAVEAGGGGCPSRLSWRPGSDIREDLDPRRSLDPGGLHPARSARWWGSCRLLAVGNWWVRNSSLPCFWQAHHPVRGASVLDPQRLEFVIELPPCGVVTDVVPDGKCGAHVVSPPGTGLPAPDAGEHKMNRCFVSSSYSEYVCRL